GDPVERGHAALRARGSRQKRRLEGAVRTPSVAAVDLRDVSHGHCVRGAHASSARVSRSRSKIAAPATRQTAAVPPIQAQSFAGIGRKKKRVSWTPEKNV